MNDSESMSLNNNADVAELLHILKLANAEKPLETLTDILHSIGNAEKQLKSVVTELQDVKRQLDEIKNKQNPFKTAFMTMVNNLESKITEMREQLDALKQSIIDGAKRAVSAFREHGMSALNKVLDIFFRGLKSELTITKNTMQQHIKSSEKSIAKIDAISSEIHEVGAHVRNIGRAARGKELVGKRENGKLAKAVQSPHRALKNISVGIEKSVSAAITKIEQREQRREKEKKPSLLKALESNRAIVAANKTVPAVNKAKKQEASL